MEEKLCLQWNDFQDNVKNTFGNLRNSNDFIDVTLAFEDGQEIEAHKVILAASSPVFEALLKRNKHSHPLICMRGLNSNTMVAMVDFLYFGEVNVHQENLESFLAIAEELQLKGLRGSNDDQNEPTEADIEQKQKSKTDQSMLPTRENALKERTRYDHVLIPCAKFNFWSINAFEKRHQRCR